MLIRIFSVFIHLSIIKNYGFLKLLRSVDTIKFSETSFKGKALVVDMCHVSFEELLKVKLSPIFFAVSQMFIPGDMVDFRKTGHT